MDALPPNLKLKILSALNVDADEASSPPSQKIPKVFELSHLDEKRLKILTKGDLVKLNEYGYLIKNGFLGDQEEMGKCREAVLELEGKSLLKPASMKGKHSWKQSKLRGDLTTWINPA
eukprot:CAMPEP_0185265530 /NCGR_PEP_ID=MMETSP1359-20130426/27860_1 /TAXON_ID=552665 /ORGANISM="Bigelowiella longifila, Strain CCMP242" /LENGTH=117 /DNA_ID=CAMNT_0027854837 /DNA_START=148 /DNA_END=498 /DNA_ORIENTATION=+